MAISQSSSSSLSFRVGPSVHFSLTLQLCKWINLVAPSLKGKVEWCACVRAQRNIHVCAYPHMWVCEREWNINTKHREENRWRKKDTMCMFHCEIMSKNQEVGRKVQARWNSTCGYVMVKFAFLHICVSVSWHIWKGEEWFICHKLQYVKIKYVFCVFFCPLGQMFITWSPKIESYPLINHVPALLSSSFPVSLQER